MLLQRKILNLNKSQHEKIDVVAYFYFVDFPIYLRIFLSQYITFQSDSALYCLMHEVHYTPN